MSFLPEGLLGELVVLDLDGGWLIIGRLQRADAHWLQLADADVHDMREGSSTRDVYALDTQRYGVRVNRRQVFVPLARVVAIARLDAVSG
ncbi:MAG: hypothetical protein RMM29_02315 [Planctomycetota bacterium]|nr:hypothetical protein [Planctomycetota bacterium]MCX8040233.1 hypothetical protein [Planctomycetota bacterium]MDW8372472.1 hypothetical protein [Planctomycetota bacterium]